MDLFARAQADFDLHQGFFEIHAQRNQRASAGVERLVRNSLWKGRTPERFYDAMEWLYGWNVGNCLDAAQR